MSEPSAEPESLLSVRSVSRRFGGLQALDDVSLEVRDGEVVGLIGPNGAGKTTLFNVVAGMTAPDSGAVVLDGVDVTDLPAHARTRRGMARTFQNIRLFRQLSVLENVSVAFHFGRGFRAASALLPLGPERRARRAGREAARAALHRVGLDGVEQQVADELSYGDQRRLEIARALATGPRVVLLDEPAAGLNSTETADLLQLIRALRADGLSIVLVEHNMQLVMDACDVVCVLAAGRRIACDVPALVAADQQVREVYLG